MSCNLGKTRTRFTVNSLVFIILFWFLVENFKLSARTKDARDTRDAFLESVYPCDLCFNLFFSKPLPARFVPSPATLFSWNAILGEVHKINLRKKFVDSPYDFHIWADDSNKAGNDRHVVGTCCWHPHLGQ